MLVRNLALSNSTSLDAGSDIIDALCVMFRRREKILPVFREQKYIGTVNITNYVKILKNLGDYEPTKVPVVDIMDFKEESVSPNTDVHRVLDRLCEKGVYGIPVELGSEYLGLVKRQDFLRNFSHKIKDQFKVRDVMSYSVTVKNIEDTLDTLSQLILDGFERRFVITNNEQVEGTVTLTALCNILFTDRKDLDNMLIRDVLNINPITVSDQDDISKVAQIMLEWGVAAALS
jgi:CBS domain-containing protein